jgi:uncharacterized OB-fold protein
VRDGVDTVSTYAKPLPKIDPVNRPFWDHAREGRLAIQVCNVCKDAHFPPSPVCPSCLSEDQAWQPVSGRGTLESWVEFHRAYWDGFKDDLPYSVCLVRLAEGPLLVSNLVGDAAKAKLGAAVNVVFEQATDEVTLPKFALA